MPLTENATLVEVYNQNFLVLASLLGEVINGLNDLAQVVNYNADVVDYNADMLDGVAESLTSLCGVVDGHLAATEALTLAVVTMNEKQENHNVVLRNLVSRGTHDASE